MHLMNTLQQKSQKFLKDDCGSISVLPFLLITVVIALGSIAGVGMVRDHVAQEFGDMAAGLDRLDQSFSYQIIVDGTVCHESSYIDDSATLSDPSDVAPAGLSFSNLPTGESGLGSPPSGAFP